jgi:hypothetical protein
MHLTTTYMLDKKREEENIKGLHISYKPAQSRTFLSKLLPALSQEHLYSPYSDHLIDNE